MEKYIYAMCFGNTTAIYSSDIYTEEVTYFSRYSRFSSREIIDGFYLNDGLVISARFDNTFCSVDFQKILGLPIWVAGDYKVFEACGL